MRKNTFEGWYFKHQNGSDMIAFIPGTTDKGAFIQMISSEGSDYFPVPYLSYRDGIIKAGDCVFSKSGCKINLDKIKGEITYGNLTTIKSDIMGPFRFFPMECRHGIISMSHSLDGSINLYGKEHSFSGGTGYIEKDSGKSFPSSYIWLQCNNFPEPCSVMLQIAHIPFYGINFKGCICSVIYGDREYRLATYNGVRICAAEAEHICLLQGKLFLGIDIKPSYKGHPLHSPVQGKMCGIIHESSNAFVKIRLYEAGKPVFKLQSNNAAYEFVPKVQIDK